MFLLWDDLFELKIFVAENILSIRDFRFLLVLMRYSLEVFIWGSFLNDRSFFSWIGRSFAISFSSRLSSDGLLSLEQPLDKSPYFISP